MTVELFNNGEHKCIMFHDLVEGNDDVAVQSNQFLIIDHGHAALIDPGGNITYNGLMLEMHNYFPADRLDYILASHGDPDIIASVNKWLIHSDSTIAISRLWVRFIPHFCTVGDVEGRIESIPDEGRNLQLGEASIVILPAHFMHSEGNFQFYDPVSKILFSGDLGASFLPSAEVGRPVTDFQDHIKYMEWFHQRYMISNRVCRYWVNMVRQLDLEWIVPQHGRPFKGKEMISEFLDWVEQLPCGIDLLTQENYTIPS